MGAWGTTLYANDTASDVKADFMELLRSGNTKETATEKLLQQYASLLEDEEEAALFWYALADTQWDRGMLLPEVLKNAQYYLEHKDIELQRWLDSSEASAKRWLETLEKLENKLRQPQPREKKVRRPRLFHCPWALGDVFAYRLSSEYSKETGYYGKYLVFRKISEQVWYPRHIIPVVKLYAWCGDTLPDLNELSALPLLPGYQSSQPEHNQFYWSLISQKEKEIPVDKLTFLGNVPGDDLVPFCGDKYQWFSTSHTVGWEGSVWNTKIESAFIRQMSWFQDGYDKNGVARSRLEKERNRAIEYQRRVIESNQDMSI